MVLGKLFSGLRKTRQKLGKGLARLLGRGRALDDALIEQIEELLYTADLGPTGTDLVAELKLAYRKKQVTTTDEVLPWLRTRLLAELEGCEGVLARATSGPTVLLVVGVNGSGKTTSIAKLAAKLTRDGHSVMLGAGDTFRAAAVEQLTLWAERLEIPIIKQGPGAKPDAVAYDAVSAAIARNVDYLILDTAGRLHTQGHLMQELEKVVRVVRKLLPDAPHETLQVLDGTTGQNAIKQASEFAKTAPVTGLLLAKMDGTAKGGAVFGIRRALRTPVKFLGVGEGVDDLEAFAAEAFVDAILDLENADKTTAEAR